MRSTECHFFLFNVTSTTEGEGFHPFLSVCLFVCLCTGYLKKLWTDPDEILWTGSVCDNDELFQTTTYMYITTNGMSLEL